MQLDHHPADNEAAMARADLYKLANYSFKLFKMIKDGDELEGWVQAKVTKAADYIASVYHYMEYEMKFSEYGEKLNNSDVYTESVKREFKRKLTEAQVKLAKLKKENIADLGEGWENLVQEETGKFDKASTTWTDKSGKKHPAQRVTRKTDQLAQGEEDKPKEKKEKKVKESAESIDITRRVLAKWEEEYKTLTGTAKSDLARLISATRRKLEADELAAQQSPTKPGAGLTPAQGANLMKSNDPNIYNKMTGQPTPAKPKMAISDPEGVKEGKKPDFLDMDKDGNKKEPMKKAVADKKKNPFGNKKVKEAEEKCNHTAKGEKCPVHGLKECGSMYEETHQEKTTMKHVKNPTAGEKKAAKDIKPGVAGYKDRVAMLKSAEKDGRLKK